MPGREEVPGWAVEAIYERRFGKKPQWNFGHLREPDARRVAEIQLELAVAAPAIRNHERQRIQEALIGPNSILAWQGSRPSLIVSPETFERVFAELDTLDPFGEQGEEERPRIERELREYPEVRWDRFIEYGGMVRVYGWLDRHDGRADFLLLDFDAATGELREWITSAHPHPASVVERLESDASVECQRVEDHFEIPNAVRLDQVPDQPKAGSEGSV